MALEEQPYMVGKNGESFKIYSPHKLSVADTVITERQRAYYIVAEGTDDNTYICTLMSDSKDAVPFERNVLHYAFLEEKCTFTGQNTKVTYHFPITLLK